MSNSKDNNTRTNSYQPYNKTHDVLKQVLTDVSSDDVVKLLESGDEFTILLRTFAVHEGISLAELTHIHTFAELNIVREKYWKDRLGFNKQEKKYEVLKERSQEMQKINHVQIEQLSSNLHDKTLLCESLQEKVEEDKILIRRLESELQAQREAQEESVNQTKKQAEQIGFKEEVGQSPYGMSDGVSSNTKKTKHSILNKFLPAQQSEAINSDKDLKGFIEEVVTSGEYSIEQINFLIDQIKAGVGYYHIKKIANPNIKDIHLMKRLLDVSMQNSM